jgi:hypothetical protein
VVHLPQWCDVSGSRSGVVSESSLLGHDVVSVRSGLLIQ